MGQFLWWSALCLTTGAAVWVVVRCRQIAAVGSAYKAKVLCTAIFCSGRAIDPQRADEVSADTYRILRLFRAHVDRAGRSVTASLFGLSARTAVYRPGLGATLIAPDR